MKGEISEDFLQNPCLLGCLQEFCRCYTLAKFGCRVGLKQYSMIRSKQGNQYMPMATKVQQTNAMPCHAML